MNDVLADPHVGFLCDLLKWFLAVLGTVLYHQLLCTICELWWMPRTWTVSGCACFFVLGPDVLR
jgi:hypothetical protein